MRSEQEIKQRLLESLEDNQDNSAYIRGVRMALRFVLEDRIWREVIE